MAKLHQASRKIGGVPPSHDQTAFCYGIRIDREDSGILCDLHFHKAKFDLANVTHEAVHAGMRLGSVVRLDMECHRAEEMLCESVEHMVDGIWRGIRPQVVRKRKAKL
jgi:hypothetical protein